MMKNITAIHKILIKKEIKADLPYPNIKDRPPETEIYIDDQQKRPQEKIEVGQKIIEDLVLHLVTVEINIHHHITDTIEINILPNLQDVTVPNLEKVEALSDLGTDIDLAALNIRIR